MRVVFLIGRDTPSARAEIDAVCRISGIQPIAVLMDTHRESRKQRFRNLKRNLRREGWGYGPRRLLGAFRDFTDRLVERAVHSPEQVEALLRKAFPDHAFAVEDLAARHGFEVKGVGSLNGPAAIEALRRCDADLGIVLGTRILKPTTFDIPRLGCINLHKGRVPDYRGMPPGFWELYDGARTAGVTVHAVSKQLDAGDIIETGEVAISPVETPESLAEKLNREGSRVLARAVAALQAGTAQRRKQPPTDLKPRTRPTHAHIEELRARLPHWARPVGDVRTIVKNAVSLAIYHSGIYDAVRKSRKGSRAAIVLHHRVNDYSRDCLTVDLETFAGQLLGMASRYPVISTTELVRRLRAGEPFPATSVCVHFDDAYLDVLTNGGPLLKATGMPATWFVSSGFVGTDRAFGHDDGFFPFQYPNCTRADLLQWRSLGFEVGAHTVNHVDLGAVEPAQVRDEIVRSGIELSDMLGEPMHLFSFPFGKTRNIRSEAVAAVRTAGYSALFSAHGGFVQSGTDLYNIPRLGGVYKALYLLLEIEELDAAGLARRVKRLLRRPAPAQALPAPQPERSRTVGK